ncbi:MAG: hypothetical protein C0404_15110 [Verrucomicrobia bacterium]|nr:hypothetical protein [Verrucomicrobiota bacterium]
MELYEMLRKATLTLPALEVTLLVVIFAVCLVFRFSRVGLVAGYIFVYRWGWIFFADHEQSFLVSYLVFGMVVGTLAVVQMMRSSVPHQND